MQLKFKAIIPRSRHPFAPVSTTSFTLIVFTLFKAPGFACWVSPLSRCPVSLPTETPNPPNGRHCWLWTCDRWAIDMSEVVFWHTFNQSAWPLSPLGLQLSATSTDIHHSNVIHPECHWGKITSWIHNNSTGLYWRYTEFHCLAIRNGTTGCELVIRISHHVMVDRGMHMHPTVLSAGLWRTSNKYKLWLNKNWVVCTTIEYFNIYVCAWVVFLWVLSVL